MTRKKNLKQQLLQIDEIVTKLEEPNLELENALLLFKKGMKLTNNCQKQLQEAKQQVTLFVNNQTQEFTNIMDEN